MEQPFFSTIIPDLLGELEADTREVVALYPYNGISAIKELRTRWPSLSLRMAKMLVDGATRFRPV